MSKRILLILLPVTIAFALVFGIYKGIKPTLQKWLLSQVNRISQEKLPVQIKIENVDWNLLFPEIILTGVEIKPKDFDLPGTTVQKVTASLDLFAIVSGKLAISSLLLDEPTAQIQLDNYLKDNSNPNEPLPTKELFQLLKKVPISRFGIHNGHIILNSKKMKFDLDLDSADLLLDFRKDRLSLQMDLNDSKIEIQKSGEIPFRLQGEALMTASTLDISSLKLGALNSILTAKGSITDLPRIHIQPRGTIEFEAFSELEQLAGAAKKLFQFPDLSGKISSSGRVDFSSHEKLNSGFKFSAQQLKISQFDIGDVQFQGAFQNNAFIIPKVALTNEAGLVDINELKLALTDKDDRLGMDVSAHVTSEQVDINELLQRLGVGDLPLEVFVAADLKCSGPALPNPNIQCEGKASAEQLEVRTGPKFEDIIVLVDAFKAEGSVNITDTNVNYKAQLFVGNDKGQSDGVISYKEGFKINYSSPEFHFANIRRLAGLKLEGWTELSGSTQGDSNAATFDIKMKTKDLFFEDFNFGGPTGTLNYEKGVLYFSNIEGSFPQTQYLANVEVDLNKKRIKTAGQLSKLDLPEVLSVFHRIFEMPVELTGSGSAIFNVEGPFQLGQLSYDLQANINRGSLAGETFDRAEVFLRSQSGEMKIEKAIVAKNKNSIEVSGVSHPNGHIDLKISGRGLPIEESENVSKLGSQISGILDVDTTLKGFILSPEVQIAGRLSQLSVEEQDFAESTFDLQLTKQSLRGDSTLFGGQLKTKFSIPFAETAPFQLQLQAQDWNYTTLFALIGGGSLLNEYQASLTGDLSLESEKGGMWASSGQGTIQNFLLQRGSLSLRNPLPMEMKMTEGIISLKNFRVEGDQTFFEAQGREISYDDLRVHVEAQANLRLFQIFLPFLEELGGAATVSADVSGEILKPEILGNGNVRSGFAKIKGFPHPFEKVQADVQFSQSKVLINGFLGNLAGGTFEGDGSILIEGPRNLPTTIRAHLEGVNLNVPDRVRTSGEADVVFSGNWFPFTLSGTYHVQEGFVDKELTDESSGTNLKQSSYLPKMILQSAFEPVLLDLNIILEKPLVVRNSMVDGAVNGTIQVRGAPTHPTLGGQLTAERGTKAIFRDKVFDIQTANIRFNTPDEINPELYVSARSRISEHDISMLIQGNAKNPVLKLSSVPPLAEQDIISLIALGVTTEGLEKRQVEANQNRDSAAGAVALNVFTQIKAIRDFQKTTGFELQFSNSFDDTRKISVQKFTISKKINEKVRASASQMSSSALNTKEYTLQYSFTDNVSAIGRYEDRQPTENSGSFENVIRQNQSILGIDLEFKKEFK